MKCDVHLFLVKEYLDIDEKIMSSKYKETFWKKCISLVSWQMTQNNQCKRPFQTPHTENRQGFEIIYFAN